MVLDSTPRKHPTSISNILNIYGLNLDVDFAESKLIMITHYNSTHLPAVNMKTAGCVTFVAPFLPLCLWWFAVVHGDL